MLNGRITLQRTDKTPTTTPFVKGATLYAGTRRAEHATDYAGPFPMTAA